MEKLGVQLAEHPAGGIVSQTVEHDGGESEIHHQERQDRGSDIGKETTAIEEEGSTERGDEDTDRLTYRWCESVDEHAEHEHVGGRNGEEEDQSRRDESGR